VQDNIFNYMISR